MQRSARSAGWVPLALTAILTACSDQKPPDDRPNPPSGNGSPSPLTVSGTVVDTQGKPLAGATVIVEPSITKGAVTLTTGADGKYRAESLLDTVYTVRAWKRHTFNGEQYCLRLAMPNASDYDDFNVRNGAVRNFRWQLTGPIGNAPDATWYFGRQNRLDRTGELGGCTLELRFTPTRPLLDGSSASTFTGTLQVGSSRTLEVTDIPVAS